MHFRPPESEQQKTELQKMSSDFRKCSHQDTGYCKFKEECKYQHFETKCKKVNCKNEKCAFRHPKPCKYAQKCRHLAKDKCAYEHAQEDETREGTEEILKVKLTLLEDQINQNKVEHDAKLNELQEAINNLRKTAEENLESKKAFEKKIKDLEKGTNEIKSLRSNICELSQLNENMEHKIDTKIKKENGKVMKEIELLKIKFSDNIVKENIDSLGEAIKLIKKDLESKEVKLQQILDKQINKANEPDFQTHEPNKETIEKNIMEGFENDSKDILDVRKNCGLDIASQKCNKCKFKTHSEGLLRNHGKEVHKLNKTFENIVEGFEIDSKKHLELLKVMYEDDDIQKVKCKKCDFKTHSGGKLKMHEREKH